jgi:predicted ATP-grasp superfamily ATP-dependent carboligase
MKTRDAVQDIIAMARCAHSQDIEAFELLMPDNLPDAQRMLSTSLALICTITEGPNQDAAFDYLSGLAEKFGEKETP